MVLQGILGQFVFINATIPFQGIARTQNWKHPAQNIVGGGLPPVQYTGRDNDEITITAELRPEITGGANSVEYLRRMADTGSPHPLILGNGRLMGSFVITAISENGSEINRDGTPRAISFSMTLKKVSDTALGVKGTALQLAVTLARNLAGI